MTKRLNTWLGGAALLIGGAAFLITAISAIHFGLNGQVVFNTPGPPPIVYQISGQLSSAQILALFATPVVVIPAQGSGTLIIVDSFDAELVFNSAAYVNNGFFQANYGISSVASPAVGSCSSSFIKASASSVCIVTASNSNISAALSVNQPVNIGLSVAVVAGNSPVNWWIKYHVLTGL